jgi:hypothetical protein
VFPKPVLLKDLPKLTISAEQPILKSNWSCKKGLEINHTYVTLKPNCKIRSSNPIASGTLNDFEINLKSSEMPRTRLLWAIYNCTAKQCNGCGCCFRWEIFSDKYDECIISTRGNHCNSFIPLVAGKQRSLPRGVLNLVRKGTLRGDSPATIEKTISESLPEFYFASSLQQIKGHSKYFLKSLFKTKDDPALVEDFLSNLNEESLHIFPDRSNPKSMFLIIFLTIFS